MNQENAVFDRVLKASPEEFIKDWIAEISASGSSLGSSAATVQNDARELLEALRSAVAADADLGRLDDAPWAKTCTGHLRRRGQHRRPHDLGHRGSVADVAARHAGRPGAQAAGHQLRLAWPRAGA